MANWAFEHPFLTFFLICAFFEMVTAIFAPHCKECRDFQEHLEEHEDD